ncbi:ACT domain-containing protein ACR3-like [Helianthus annuus]|uniref:ACT domain-containing protein ACR3-like n=1 Tax=Helianthus annuus TaxID=4232 RepID=UPI000B8F68EF|nr:ACT domain-containing protein ACR3-like [Helianthus annuus]
MVENYSEKGYIVVHLQCPDWPKLLFDIVCTLTDMQYVVYHATIIVEGVEASQELYICHTNGCPISSETERERVIHCHEAVVKRHRDSSGTGDSDTTGPRPIVSDDLESSEREVHTSDVTSTYEDDFQPFALPDEAVELADDFDMEFVDPEPAMALEPVVAPDPVLEHDPVHAGIPIDPFNQALFEAQIDPRDEHAQHGWIPADDEIPPIPPPATDTRHVDTSFTFPQFTPPARPGEGSSAHPFGHVPGDVALIH